MIRLIYFSALNKLLVSFIFISNINKILIYALNVNKSLQKFLPKISLALDMYIYIYIYMCYFLLTARNAPFSFIITTHIPCIFKYASKQINNEILFLSLKNLCREATFF
jgi:hypothetical protein